MRKILMSFCIALLPLFAMAQLPPIKAENGVRFIAGGVGLSESDAIKAESIHWPVQLSFSRAHGQQSEWISNALIIIRDSKGAQVFSHQVDGPMILINLRPGKYIAQSVYEGQSKTIHLNVVSGERLKVNFQWK
jgi:hypothetical protein